MNTDAKITLYGGFTIGVALYLLGLATDRTVALTGIFMLGGVLAVVALFEISAPE